MKVDLLLYTDMRRDIFVFDIETVVDCDAVRNLLGCKDANDTEARNALTAYCMEKSGGKNDFPRQPFHQVVAISYAQLIREPGEQGCEIILRRVASGGDVNSDERSLLEGFFGLIEKRAPQLVSYNGRGFDIPVLKYRAMKHGIPCSRWFSEGDKWSNYDARYANRYHVDLLEIFSGYGAAARCSLNELAAVMAIPGKLETTGGDVRTLFEAGDIESIRNYCETDVLTTTLLYLRWQYFNGSLGRDAFARALAGIHHYLESESGQHLHAYLEAWDALSPGSS